MENERMEQMLTQLIQMVGHTNAAVATLQKDMTEVKDTVMRIEYCLNITEHKQVKMGTRLDTVEAKVEILSTPDKN